MAEDAGRDWDLSFISSAVTVASAWNLLFLINLNIIPLVVLEISLKNGFIEDSQLIAPNVSEKWILF